MTARFAVPILLGLLAGCAGATQLARTDVPLPLDEAVPRDPSVRMGVLENGLRYYVRQNVEPRNRVELRLVVNAGSVLEDSDQLGLAHVVEHMAFNGTTNFEKQELVDYLEAVGMRFGPDINAYTSFDETVYMLTLPTDSAGVVETGFQILEDWAHGVTFDSTEIEKERGVVIEEWRVSQGAGTRVRDRHLPVLFEGSRYAERLPIGTRSSLETFDHDALRRFYDEWYRPDMMSVVVVGDVEPDRAEALVREHFERIPAREAARERPAFPLPPHDDTRVSVVTDPEATQTSLSLYLKRPARRDETPAAYRRWITESLASAMLGNRIHELTQVPEAPVLDVSSFQGRLVRPTDALVLTAVVPDGAVVLGAETVMLELLRAARDGFAATELEREKTELLRLMEQRHAERARITSSEFASQYVSHYLYGGTLPDADTEWTLYRWLVPEIELDEVNSVVRAWTDRHDRVMLVTAPQRSAETVPEAAELAQLLAAVDVSTLGAYDDGVSDAPLLAELPTPGTIVAEEQVPEVELTEWRLSNGARVLLRPTDFKDDEILFVSRSPGGTSLLPDEDYIPALTASAVVQMAGLGDLTLTELRKRLAGTMAGVGAEIGELHQGLSGAASPQDLETLFQLIHLRFTATRADTVSFLTYQTQARERTRNRGLSPDAHFADSLQVALAQGHPRARPISAAMFDSLDLHRSLEIFRDRFSDAGDFTFYFVGSFDPEELRPLVEQYIASLPSYGRTDQWRDIGIQRPEGIVRKTVRRGLEPRARTQIVFHGPFEFEREQLYLLSSLAEVLQLRLRESLREDLGGTYGVGVQAAGVRDPRPEFRLAIGFGTAPERLDELVQVVFDEIESIKRDGPRESDLTKVREIQYRAREVELRENQFWIAQILSYDRYGWDMREIPRHERRVERLTAERLQQAAIRYLDMQRYVHVSLVPESTPIEELGGS
jgi:zinc protease